MRVRGREVMEKGEGEVRGGGREKGEGEVRVRGREVMEKGGEGG